MSWGDVGPSTHSGLPPCAECGSVLCGGYPPHAWDWDSPEVERAAHDDLAARQAAQMLSMTHVCAECGGRLVPQFYGVWGSHWGLVCTEDARHEDSAAPRVVETVDASMLQEV